MNRALIFGASGQMGYYLSEFLKSKGYVLCCPSAGDFNFLSLDLSKLSRMIEDVRPTEIYNLVGLNYADNSWLNPEKYMQVNGNAVLQLLMAMANSIRCKFFQAGSAEIFEKASVLQAEDTNRLPASPYGLSKMMAMEWVRLYRERYGFFACTGTFFNAESPRRSKFFFAEKVVAEAVRIRKEQLATGTWTPMKLASLEARRDWGWAPEYVEVAWKMLQQEKPHDLVIGTGETHTCLEYVIEALTVAGVPDVASGFRSYVSFEENKSFVRGNCMKAWPLHAEMILGWKAQYKFKDVVRMLVEAEMRTP